MENSELNLSMKNRNYFCPSAGRVIEISLLSAHNKLQRADFHSNLL